MFVMIHFLRFEMHLAVRAVWNINSRVWLQKISSISCKYSLLSFSFPRHDEGSEIKICVFIMEEIVMLEGKHCISFPRLSLTASLELLCRYSWVSVFKLHILNVSKGHKPHPPVHVETTFLSSSRWHLS